MVMLNGFGEPEQPEEHRTCKPRSAHSSATKEMPLAVLSGLLTIALRQSGLSPQRASRGSAAEPWARMWALRWRRRWGAKHGKVRLKPDMGAQECREKVIANNCRTHS